MSPDKKDAQREKERLSKNAKMSQQNSGGMC